MNRIDAIVKRIKRKKCIVADIGSDHAFLALSLLKSKNIGKIFNVEINKKPLNTSINNTKRYAKTKKVINVLNDGLRKWKYDKYFDYVVISGMGGNNIINIIKNIDKEIKIDNLILVPNNGNTLLRKFLSKQGWYFKYEQIILEHKYYYQLIHVTKHKTVNCLAAKNKNDYYFGVYNLKHQSANFSKMLKHRLQFIKNNPQAIKYNKNIKQEMELINDYFKRTI